MTDWDEHLAYFTILTQLLREAGLQLDADVDVPVTRIYAEDLDMLRGSLSEALEAATAILARVQAQRAVVSAQALNPDAPSAAIH